MFDNNGNHDSRDLNEMLNLLNKFVDANTQYKDYASPGALLTEILSLFKVLSDLRDKHGEICMAMAGMRPGNPPMDHDGRMELLGQLRKIGGSWEICQ